MFKIENKEKNINYVQINQEIKSKTIEKSEMDPNIFINFLVIFKSQKLFLNYLKLFKLTENRSKIVNLKIKFHKLFRKQIMQNI